MNLSYFNFSLLNVSVNLYVSILWKDLIITNILYFRTSNSDCLVECTVSFDVDGQTKSVSGLGQNKKIAKATASKKAIDFVRD